MGHACGHCQWLTSHRKQELHVVARSVKAKAPKCAQITSTKALFESHEPYSLYGSLTDMCHVPFYRTCGSLAAKRFEPSLFLLLSKSLRQAERSRKWLTLILIRFTCCQRIQSVVADLLHTWHQYTAYMAWVTPTVSSQTISIPWTSYPRL